MIQALFRRARFFRAEQRGQALPVIALMLVVIIGMCGFSVDTGRAFLIHRQLQAATDAAAMAGASVLPGSTAVATANSYSALAGNANARSSLSGATMVSGYPKVVCLSTLTNQGMACSSPGNGNAVVVKEQIPLKLIFLQVVGLKTITIAASSTASMAGGPSRPPYNVAIIVDTSGSMNDTDSDSNCNSTRISCALAGMQQLLGAQQPSGGGLTPCSPSLSTCGTADNTGNYATAVDRVALYTFPGLASATDAQHEYDCSGITPAASLYTDGPSPGQNMPVYKVVDYSSNYRTSDSATTLNTSSNLVKALGGNSNCTGLQAGLKTGKNLRSYSAGAMYAAGLDLINLQSTYPKSQGIVIIIMDGDMNAPPGDFPNASTTSGVYPSSKNECAQGVALASYATNYNVLVYTVAYGATSSGCTTDSSGITPCQMVQQMASGSQYFYSDYTATGGSSNCISAAHSTTGLSSIFQQILTNLSPGRLIPDNTT